MDNPGLKNLGDVALAAINAATIATVVTSQPDGNGETQAFVDRLEGMEHAALQAYFQYGSGGGTLKVMIETTLDQGVTWVEVGRFAFAAATAEKLLSLKAVAERLAAYTPVDLADDTGLSGFFGNRWRARILKAGSAYAGNTSLSLRLHAR